MNPTNLKFSIIVPTFNREAYIARAIQSIISQDYPRWELIIIDNLSTDNTLAIIKENLDQRIRLFVNDKNYERCYSRNKGVDVSTGDYLLFLDSDDYFESDHLSQWVNAIVNNNINSNFLICNKKITENYTTIIGDSHEKRHQYITYYDYVFDQIVLPGQVCIKRGFLNKLKFQDRYLLFEDTALWLQLMYKETPLFFDFHTFVYIRHETNSVNWKSANFGKVRLKSLKAFIEENKLLTNIIGRKIFKKELMITNFIIAKHYIYVGDKSKAIYYLIKTIFLYPTSYQLRHRLLLITRLLINSNYEYKNQ